MEDQTQMQDFGEQPEPCLAGTLCLMGNYRRSHCPQIAQKIVHNLFVLSHQTYFSQEFRVVLAQLHADWLPDAQDATEGVENYLDESLQTGPLH